MTPLDIFQIHQMMILVGEYTVLWCIGVEHVLRIFA
jgi:hypothetical protein